MFMFRGKKLFMFGRIALGKNATVVRVKVFFRGTLPARDHNESQTDVVTFDVTCDLARTEDEGEAEWRNTGKPASSSFFAKDTTLW